MLVSNLMLLANSKAASTSKHQPSLETPAPPPIPMETVQLHASSSPFLVVPSYWSQVQAAEARRQVLEAQSVCHDVGEGGDVRTMGVSEIARSQPERFRHINAFFDDAQLHAIAVKHLGRSHLLSKTMAGATAPGQCSGGGWHKDVLTRGFKALIYLDDVFEEAAGPFAMLLNYSDSDLHHNADRRRSRFDDDAVAAQQSQHGARVQPIYGAAGTLVLFETSSVHRGLPCTAGGRVALTNYYSASPVRPPVSCSADSPKNWSQSATIATAYGKRGGG